MAVDATEPSPLGATVNVTVPDADTARAAVIKLPTSALRQEGQTTAVWLLDRGTMTLRSQPIQIAAMDGNDAVVAAGLEPRMLVVSAGAHVLSAGQKVSIYKPKVPVSHVNKAQAAPDLIVPAGLAAVAGASAAAVDSASAASVAVSGTR